MRVLGYVIAYTCALPLACVGLLVRGVYEGLRLGWGMPEHVQKKRMEDAAKSVFPIVLADLMKGSEN